MGGSSATNNAMALRGHPADYDAWAAAGNPGLPTLMLAEHLAVYLVAELGA